MSFSCDVDDAVRVYRTICNEYSSDKYELVTESHSKEFLTEFKAECKKAAKKENKKKAAR